MIDAKEGALENPVVDKICDKCGYGKMSYACRQTRSADEGQTVFYRCLKCNYNMVENAWNYKFMYSNTVYAVIIKN